MYTYIYTNLRISGKIKDQGIIEVYYPSFRYRALKRIRDTLKTNSSRLHQVLTPTVNRANFCFMFVMSLRD